MTENAIFIFVAAGNCGGCNRFKRDFWDKTYSELTKIPNLHVIKHEVSKLGDPLPPDAHKDLKRFINWYPTFILVNRSSYEKANLEGIVFNGKEIKDGKWTLSPIGERQATDNETIVAWVKNQLTNNSLFKKGVSFTPLVSKSILKPPKQNKSNDDSEYSDEDDEIYTPTYCQQSFIPFN